MADEPEAPSAEVQPISESAVRAEAVAAAEALFPDAGAEAESPGGTGEETTPEDGDGGEASAESGIDADPDEGAPDPYAEMPTDPEAQKTWLKERDERTDADFKERMDNQKRSILGNQNTELAAKDAADKRAATITELEEMDDLELGERLKEDAEAAKAWADHKGQLDPQVAEAGRAVLTNEIVPMLFKAGDVLEKLGGPNLRKVYETDPETVAKIDELEGRSYEWLVTEAHAAGANGAVEKFKSSKAYKDDIAAAKAAGAHDALGNIGAPPSRDNATATPSRSGDPEYTDDRLAAMAAAGLASGSPLSPTEIGEYGRGRRRAAR